MPFDVEDRRERMTPMRTCGGHSQDSWPSLRLERKPRKDFEQPGVRIQVELWADDYRLSAGLQGLCTTPGGAIDLEHIMNGAPELYHAQP